MSAELQGSALTLYAVPANLKTRKVEGVSEILQTERASCSARPIVGSLDWKCSYPEVFTWDADVEHLNFFKQDDPD